MPPVCLTGVQLLAAIRLRLSTLALPGILPKDTIPDVTGSPWLSDPQSLSHNDAVTERRPEGHSEK